MGLNPRILIFYMGHDPGKISKFGSFLGLAVFIPEEPVFLTIN
jgi:hypothetical protein